METRRGVMTSELAARSDYVTLPWSPGRQRGGMAEKRKSRGTGAKSKLDKSRTPVRGTLGRRAHPGRSPGPGADRVRAGGRGTAALSLQRVPFAVSRARDAILFVAEWRFLVRDDGDPDRAGDPDPERDGVWSEDEEPQTSHWDSCTPGVVSVTDVPLPSEEVPSKDLSVTAEAEEGPLACPGEVRDAVSLPDVPLSPVEVPAAMPPCQSPSAAAAAPSAQVLGAVTAVPVTEPPQPEPPIAPRSPRRAHRFSRPQRPRPAPLDASRPPAPAPAVPSQPPAQAPRESREGTAAVGTRVPPAPPSSRTSLASVLPRRSSRGTGVPRLGARRDAARWVLPKVKVIDVTTEPERARPVGSRSRIIPSGNRQVLPVAGRAPKGEPQLCDPWLASVRLAPGVTVRWGNSERRGPAPVWRGGHGNGEQEEDEEMRRAEKELKPILPSPECLISEYSDGEEQLENPLGMRRLPGAVPAPGVSPVHWVSSAPRVVPEQEMAPATAPCGSPGPRGSLPALLKKTQK
ncbi:uncharacterized protein C2orf81 homolog [Cinclus cinclus]|uniref:uncharacterized protein C2orf81 homolog n=1 Tax=Cinclus cinclus TaxID=127875 RepID=UPI002E1262F3